MKTTQILRFALRQLARDWRAGELRILAAALVIAVGAITAVGFFTDRVRLGMVAQAGELLAADLAVAAHDPLGADKNAQAQALGLRTTEFVGLRSVALAGDATQLVEIKAVTQGYPLRGTLRIADRAFASDRTVDTLPEPGTVWVETRLLQLLNIGVGETLQLGNAQFRIAALLTFEPDRGGDAFSVAPRVLMRSEDLPATGLIQPGSRAEYRLLAAGDTANIRDFRAWLKARLAPGQNLLTVEEGRPELRTALERAERFLGLAALLSVLLAGVAVAAAARRYSERHLDATAVLRCFGATQGLVVRIFTFEMLALAVFASLVGAALGFVAQEGLTRILGQLLLADLPLPSWQPLVPGLATGLITLLGFALPPLAVLKNVPPLRVLRRDLGPLPPPGWFLYGTVVAAITALVFWQAEDAKLAAIVLAGALATVAVLGGAASGLVKLVSPLRDRVGIAWRFGLANIARRARASSIQVVALGVGIMVLVLLAVVRADLLDAWRGRLPTNAPNHFLINIQGDQVKAVQEFFRTRGVETPGLYPMVRARLTAINGEPVVADRYSEVRAQRLVTREFNLSWAAQPQTDNRIVAGRWWQPNERGRHVISVEQELANTLGLKLGDTLNFNVSGTDVALEVTSLRKVKWDSFQVNFFTVLPPGVLEDQPAQWITSLYLAPRDKAVLTELVRAFPNVTVIDVDALMVRVRSLMDRVSAALEYVFLFALAAGLAVLYAAIASTHDQRRYETALLRTLGARREHLLRGLTAEFVTLGAAAGLLAGLAATLIAYVLGVYIFEVGFRFNPWVGIVSMALGAIGVGIAGVLGTRSVLNQPPLATLRQA
jgi:putative ABC transport system permease protein